MFMTTAADQEGLGEVLTQAFPSVWISSQNNVFKMPQISLKILMNKCVIFEILFYLEALWELRATRIVCNS